MASADPDGRLCGGMDPPREAVACGSVGVAVASVVGRRDGVEGAISLLLLHRLRSLRLGCKRRARRLSIENAALSGRLV